jgi:hypothetical protein
MKKMIRVAALALVAVSLLSSKSIVKDQPAPQCYPDCVAQVIPDQPAPQCYPDCLAQSHVVPDQPAPQCYPDCSL